MKYKYLFFVVLLGLGACDSSTDGETTPEESDVYMCDSDGEMGCADVVVEAPGKTDVGVGDPTRAVNGVRGCGVDCGSLDVYSLGVGEDDNFIVLRWTGRRVTNGPGTDFVVFENPFDKSDGSTFVDAAVVYLSTDGSNWVAYPFDYVADDETVYVGDSELWTGFAGVVPVTYHEEDNEVDPFDLALAGGDHFDLDLLPDSEEALAIKENGFSFIKIVSSQFLTNDDTGEDFVADPISNGADIDGVYARYLVLE